MVITSVTVTTEVFAFAVAVTVVIIIVQFILAYQLSGDSLLVSPHLFNRSKPFAPALYK